MIVKIRKQTPKEANSWYVFSDVKDVRVFSPKEYKLASNLKEINKEQDSIGAYHINEKNGIKTVNRMSYMEIDKYLFEISILSDQINNDEDKNKHWSFKVVHLIYEEKTVICALMSGQDVYLLDQGKTVDKL